MANTELLAYPNPTRNSLTVEGTANHLTQLNILNKYGRDASKSARIKRSGVYYLKTPTYIINLSKL